MPHAPRLLLTLFLGLAGCAPLPDAADPEEGEIPCRSQQDCEVAVVDSGPRAQICSSRGIALGTAKDSAACGPMPNMSPALPEPRLACFRGVCVPVGKR